MLLLLIALLVVLTTPVAAQDLHLSEISNGWSQTSVNTAIFRYAPLATADSAGTRYQYACYYSEQGYLTIARRIHGTDNWTVRQTAHRAHVEDGHNVVSMAIDGNGYLHVAYDHHGNKLHYRQSRQPYALELTDEMPMNGDDEQNVTYPEFHSLPNGNLLFLYRTGRSGNGNMVMKTYDHTTKTFHTVQRNLVDGEGKRNAYWQLTTDNNGRIHLSWVWRETWMVETNHDLCYAYSDDQGATWHQSNGTTYAIPITAETAEVAWHKPQKRELINQTSMAADNNVHPYIATYWRDPDSTIPQYRLVYHDGRKWQMRQVGNRTTPFTLAGGGTKMIPIARPRMVIDGKTAILLYRDAERNSVVSAYYINYKKKNRSRQRDLTSFPVNAWEPSIDETLWDNHHQLNIFVQNTYQGDGERTVRHEPTPVYVLEVTK